MRCARRKLRKRRRKKDDAGVCMVVRFWMEKSPGAFAIDGRFIAGNLYLYIKEEMYS